MFIWRVNEMQSFGTKFNFFFLYFLQSLNSSIAHGFDFSSHALSVFLCSDINFNDFNPEEQTTEQLKKKLNNNKI